MTHSSSLSTNDILESMPRICELIALVIDRRSPDAFFQNFEETIVTTPGKKEKFQAIEAEVQRLPAEAWEALKKKLTSYLNKKDKNRAWQQAIDCLNEAKGHNYLRGIGCTDVVFVPESGRKTPDLKGVLQGRKILCDVKTINYSDVAIEQLGQLGIVGISSLRLPEAFLRKVDSTAKSAKRQIDAYYSGEAEKIVYFIINFDDWSGDYNNEYYSQIEQYFADHPINNLRVIIEQNL